MPRRPPDAERGPMAGAPSEGLNHSTHPVTKNTAGVRQVRSISPLRQLLDKTAATDGLKVKEPLPLLDSGWSFADQCRRLIASKAYRTNGVEP
jgi:hypothetical protein